MKSKSENRLYMNDYMKRRWKRRRKEAIIFLGGCCKRCNSKKNLEFDHIDRRTKLYTIAAASSFSNARFWTEVKKCQLLCGICHKQKTKKEISHDHSAENNPNAYLSNKDVIVIRKLFIYGLDKKSLMQLYSIPKWILYPLLKGVTYSTVKWTMNASPSG